MPNIEIDAEAQCDQDETYRDMIAEIVHLENYMAAQGLHVPPESE